MSIQTNDTPNARERILQTAEAMFLSGGFHSASIRELTDVAGVNVALVNYYFGSKRNLYLEVLKRKFSEIAQRKCTDLQQRFTARSSLTLEQALSDYVELYLGSEESMLAAKQYHEWISQLLTDDDDAMELLLNQLIIPIHSTLKNTLAELVPQLDSNKLSLCIGSVTGQIFHFIRYPLAFKTLVELPPGSNLLEMAAKHIVAFSLKGFEEVSA